ncbi:DNA transposition protein [Humitalea sp. 24SJ18S-53]|uniref:DNA transposition protein n=1 Tax=Humitalea sp. 24SJ18S-53 TaxID=3422307 RepID=UPI003D6773A3
MSRARPAQPDLLEWTPPVAVRAFDPARVRAATMAGRIAKAVSATLRDSPKDRPTIAAEMTAFIGERVSLHMVNAWASEAREEHGIPLVKLLALLHVTRDRRLLEMLAADLGWAVIERRHLPLIELAAVQERQDDLRRQADRLRHQARSGGGL